ncbi:MAG: DMT family transporter [Candidatus Puniceispirillaceae bacterium]
MRPLDFLLYAGVVFAWSTSWYPLSLQMGVVAVEVSLVWRFAVAATFMLALSRWRGVTLRYGRQEHVRFAMLGVFLFSTNFALYYNASLFAASGLLAVILSTSSLINVLMVAALARSWPQPVQLAASVIGLAGLGLIFAPELQMSPTVALALMLGGAGTLSFCIGNLVSAASQKRGVHVLASTSWGMVYGTGFLGLVSVVRGHDFIIDPTAVYLGSLAWLIVISSVLAFISYLSLIGSIGPGRAAYATVVFPVFALLISAIYEGYEWSSLALAGLALVMVGNLMMIRARN